MGDLSPHFSAVEFVCRGPCNDPGHGRGLVPLDTRLVGVLEAIRRLSGRPLPILSGYRCAAHNRRVGGASDSQHLHGRAADIPRGRVTLKQAWSCGAVGVGVAGGWAVHVDVRPGSRVTWDY